jgi:hypothetical protein
MADDQEIRLFRDGDQWCALRGGDLQEGVSGFGLTPEAALMELLGQEGGSIGVALRGHEAIAAAMRTSLVVLNRTEDVCQALADSGEGYVCSGCPADDTVCVVQTVRDLLIESLSKEGC